MEKVSFQNLGRYGALGNQLWQIAGTIGIADKRKALPVFPEDWFYRPYFNLPDEYFASSFEDCVDLGEQYFQDTHYWAHLKHRIQYLFRASPLMKEMINDTYGPTLSTYTAIHVRRGNNLTPQYSDYHPVCSLDFFEAAMKELHGPYIVYSDSLDWCKEQPIFEGCKFGLGPPEGVDVMELTNATPLGTVEAVFDLHAMSRSRSLIISNSSFSWWGAKLSGSSRVIYPKRWYGDPLAHIDTTVMFPKYNGWKMLDVY